MSLSTLTQKLSNLIDDRDQIQRQIDGIIDDLSGFRTPAGLAPQVQSAAQPEAPARRKPGPKPGAKRGPNPGGARRGPKPKAETQQKSAGRGGRRGNKTRGAGQNIIDLLKKAGSGGMSVADMSDKLGKKKETVHVWLYTSGKKFPELEKIGKGTWRWKG